MKLTEKQQKKIAFDLSKFLDKELKKIGDVTVQDVFLINAIFSSGSLISLSVGNIDDANKIAESFCAHVKKFTGEIVQSVKEMKEKEKESREATDES